MTNSADRRQAETTSARAPGRRAAPRALTLASTTVASKATTTTSTSTRTARQDAPRRPKTSTTPTKGPAQPRQTLTCQHTAAEHEHPLAPVDDDLEAEAWGGEPLRETGSVLRHSDVSFR